MPRLGYSEINSIGNNRYSEVISIADIRNPYNLKPQEM